MLPEHLKHVIITLLHKDKGPKELSDVDVAIFLIQVSYGLLFGIRKVTLEFLVL